MVDFQQENLSKKTCQRKLLMFKTCKWHVKNNMTRVWNNNYKNTQIRVYEALFP